MQVRSKVKFGDVVYEFVAEDGDEKKALHKAITLANIPETCICGNEKGNHLDANKDKEGNIYIKAVCGECKANATLGSHKEGGLFFWKQYEQWSKDYKTESKDYKPESRSSKEEIDIQDIDM